MIEILPYRLEWPIEFERAAAMIREALGSHARSIDHIGSTAIPGLCAKDVIDIQVTVVAFSSAIVERMTAHGFNHRVNVTSDHVPPGAPTTRREWAKLFFRQPEGHRPVNIHIREGKRLNQRFALLVRDYLRAHPSAAFAYGELKRRLAASLVDEEAYPDVKDPVIDLIYLAAEDWAISRGWKA